jgi:tRNA G18 (ribose-2'-O)-methylase SpoU
MQDFKFPRQTVLVLGREKEGIPADLLGLMHHTVEIPQLGVVRSLNVHVSGALAVWEYTRQHATGGDGTSGGGGGGSNSRTHAGALA